MYTYQMIGVADHNTRVYESEYGIYSKFTGFILSEIAKSMKTEELLYKLMHEDCWSLKNTNNIGKEYSEDNNRHSNFINSINDFINIKRRSIYNYEFWR